MYRCTVVLREEFLNAGLAVESNSLFGFLVVYRIRGCVVDMFAIPSAKLVGAFCSYDVVTA